MTRQSMKTIIKPMNNEKIKYLIKKIENSRYAFLIQFVKFGLVGAMNTLISYGTEMLCYYVLFADMQWKDGVKIAVSSAIAFFISVTNSYYWNNRFVFKNEERKGFAKHLKAYGRTVLCYGLTGLLLAPYIKIWLTGMHVPYWVASLATLIVTIPLNFLMNKFWAFGERSVIKTDEH